MASNGEGKPPLTPQPNKQQQQQQQDEQQQSQWRTPPRSQAVATENVPSAGSDKHGQGQHDRGHSRVKSSIGGINLHNVLNSGHHHEMEAETHILRAVEKLTGQAHTQTDPETSGLYSAIVAQQKAEQQQGQSEQGTKEGNINAGTKPDASGGPNVGNPLSTPAADNAAPAGTMDATAKSNAIKMKFKGLVRKSVALSNTEKKSGDDTVEDTLFGLSTLLEQMGRDDADYNKQKHSSNKQIGSFDTTFTSADKLAARTVGEAIKTKVEGEDAAAHHRKMTSLFQGKAATAAAAATTSGEGGGGDVEQGGGGPKIPEPSGDYTSSDSSGDPNDSRGDGRSGKKKKKRFYAKNIVNNTKGGLREEYEVLSEFLRGKKHSAWTYARRVFLFVMLPSVSIAFILFYFFEVFDTYADGTVVPGQDASVSWWFLFLGCRQVVTLSMAMVTQSIVVDFLALGSRHSILRWFGPIPTLLVVQSKGWSFVATFWGAYNLILLAGDERYVRHWLYFQDTIGLFNEQNPGGHVVDHNINYAFMRTMIIAGVFTAIKRLMVGLMLGRQTFAHYGQDLAATMKNMVLIGKIATLAREIENNQDTYLEASSSDVVRKRTNTVSEFLSDEAAAFLGAEETELRKSKATPSAPESATAFMENRKTMLGAKDAASSNDGAPTQEKEENITESEHATIEELLDAWEEPTRARDTEARKITLLSLMQFRQALTFMKRKYPFLSVFGPADTRERCIESAQAVYDRLMMRTPFESALPFETLVLLARNEKGDIDKEKAKELIKLIRPERDGTVGILEFVKSIDAVYKQLRLLSANISNSSQLDKAVEAIINVFYYVFLGCVVLIVFGQNPSAIFLSFSSVALGFAFMFGASASKYFEGLLFILVQRPYGVGDRIHLSNPQNETSPEGSSCWIVEKVTLTTTTVYWGTTNERATLSNGAIANLRVINAARSPNATVYVVLKFAIDTEYEKIAIFRTAVEQFLKDRPREWLCFLGFRPTDVVVDEGYIGYKIVAQHRNHWQAIISILESKASLTTYCLEVAKQLEMRYHAPPLPVDLHMVGSAASALAAIAGKDRRPSGLDLRNLDLALQANSPATRGRNHQAFSEE